MIDQPMQPPRIPEDRAAEFDLIIDITIRPRTAFEGRERAYARLRVPLNRAAFVAETRAHLDERIAATIDATIANALVVNPDA